ncbi:hypothetical protein F4604DRAFT_1684469 [Suillus subluteus]|nr:hypothetical protein F4604DRAFT_1684469 [Suillus subluteus]
MALQWVQVLPPPQHLTFAALVEAFKRDFITEPATEQKQCKKKLQKQQQVHADYCSSTLMLGSTHCTSHTNHTGSYLNGRPTSTEHSRLSHISKCQQRQDLDSGSRERRMNEGEEELEKRKGGNDYRAQTLAHVPQPPTSTAPKATSPAPTATQQLSSMVAVAATPPAVSPPSRTPYAPPTPHQHPPALNACAKHTPENAGVQEEGGRRGRSGGRGEFELKGEEGRAIPAGPRLRIALIPLQQPPAPPRPSATAPIPHFQQPAPCANSQHASAIADAARTNVDNSLEQKEGGGTKREEEGHEEQEILEVRWLCEEVSNLIPGLAVERPNMPPPTSRPASPASTSTDPSSTSTTPTLMSIASPISPMTPTPPTPSFQHQHLSSPSVRPNDTLTSANDERMSGGGERRRRGRGQEEEEEEEEYRRMNAPIPSNATIPSNDDASPALSPMPITQYQHLSTTSIRSHSTPTNVNGEETQSREDDKREIVTRGSREVEEDEEEDEMRKAKGRLRIKLEVEECIEKTTVDVETHHVPDKQPHP